MNISEFLEARIAEDEQQYEVCRELDWYPAKKYGVPALSHDRLLAECAAKRAIIAAHPITHDVLEVSTRDKFGFACETCFSYGDVVEDHGYCDTLRALAAVYKDHPDYRQEWAL